MLCHHLRGSDLSGYFTFRVIRLHRCLVWPRPADLCPSSNGWDIHSEPPVHLRRPLARRQQLAELSSQVGLVQPQTVKLDANFQLLHVLQGRVCGSEINRESIKTG